MHLRWAKCVLSSCVGHWGLSSGKGEKTPAQGVKEPWESLKVIIFEGRYDQTA